MEPTCGNSGVGIGIGVSIGIDSDMSAGSDLDPESDFDTDPDNPTVLRQILFMRHRVRHEVREGLFRK